MLRPVPDQPPRALIYCRVSMVGARSPEDLTSPEIQEQACRDYATARGYTVVGVVTDLNRTGRTLRRRQVEACVEQVEAGHADVIVVWRWSRVSRSRRDWAVLTDRVEVLGGRVESALEPMDVSTATGRLGRGMLAEFAAFESERIGETWRETHARRHRDGLPHTGYPKLGYVKDRGYTPDPDTAPLVVDAYRRYLAGHGYRLVADWLNSLAVPHPRSGGSWSNMSVQWMMDDGFAAGLLRTAAGYLPGAQPPLIEERTWLAYQAERTRRRGVPARTVAASSPLSGLVRCGSCGLSMRLKENLSRKQRQSGAVYTQRTTMLVCEARVCDRRASVTYAKAEQALLDWLRPFGERVEVARAARAAAGVQAGVARADRTRLTRQIGRLDTELVALARELAGGMMDRAVYIQAREQVSADRARAVEALAVADRLVGAPRPSQQVFRGLLAEWGTLRPLAAREVLRQMGVRIVVTRMDRPRSQVNVTGGWERDSAVHP